MHSSALTCHLSTSILARKTDFNSSLGVSLLKNILYKQFDPRCVNIQRVFNLHSTLELFSGQHTQHIELSEPSNKTQAPLKENSGSL